MSKIPYYKVSTAVKAGTKKVPEKKSFLKNKKRNRLILSVVGVYLIATAVLAGFIFNSNRDTASASTVANLSSSIRFIEEDKIELGQDLQVLVTLQNTSVVEPINEINLSLLSTKESVRWTKVENQKTKEEVISAQGSSFIIPNLGLGERAEYVLTGTYQNSELDFLTVLGKIRYQNSVGTEEIDTNRIYTNLDANLGLNNKPLKLSTVKDSYSVGENIVFNLSKNDDQNPALPEGFKGKMYINQRNTEEVVGSYDCLVEETGDCTFEVTGLNAGQYSSLFVGEGENILSGISWFNVAGQGNLSGLVPSEQTQLSFPFGAGSVNGIVPVIAQRVITQNQSSETSSPCIFEIIAGGKIVNKVEASINSDRTCRTDISTSQVGGEGLFKIKLANTALERDISFVAQGAGLLELKNQSVNLQKNQDVVIRSQNITNEEGQPLNEENLVLSIYQKQTGDLESLNGIGAERFQVKEGVFEATIPASYFQNSGVYLLHITLESGKKSDFLTVSLSDSNLAFSGTGILVDNYSTLKVGQNITFKIAEIKDKSGVQVNSGSCVAGFYSANSGAIPVEIDGGIQNGVCTVSLPANRITKAGPLLVSFKNGNANSSINQSRQFQLSAGDTSNFGEINLDFEPAFKEYSNNAIIGPVTDQFGNLTNLNGLQMVAQKMDGEIMKVFKNVNIDNGYGNVLLPASVLTEDTMKLSLQNAEGAVLNEREIVLNVAGEVLSLPEISTTVSNNDSIALKIKYYGAESVDTCKIRFVKNSVEFMEENIPYNSEDGSCSTNWELAKFRDSNKGLVQILVGDKKYSKAVNLESSEAANLFSVHPQVRFNKQNEMLVSLFTSPIVDKFGMPVKSGEIRWQYNGKIEKTQIENGFAELNITANNLEARDIRTNFDQRFLDLDIEVKAGTTSVSQTSNISIYLGDFDLSTQVENFAINSGSNYISTQYSKIFSFETNSCNAILVGKSFASKQLTTHRQGNKCFVEVTQGIGKGQILFEDKGYTSGVFDVIFDQEVQEVNWCKEGSDKCEFIQVLGPTASTIEATIYDGENQYKFKDEDLDNIVEIKQNGLNPLKEYKVEVTYQDLNGNKISHYQSILGEKLID
jgi:hypothetical protein